MTEEGKEQKRKMRVRAVERRSREEDRAKQTIEFLVKCLRSQADDITVDFDEDGVLRYVVTKRPSRSGNVVVKPRGGSYYFWLSHPSCLEKKTSWQETLSQLLGGTISLVGVEGSGVQIGELEIPASHEELEMLLDLHGLERGRKKRRPQ